MITQLFAKPIALLAKLRLFVISASSPLRGLAEG